MIALLSNTAVGGLGILATAGDPIAAAVIGGAFTIANTLLVAYLTRSRRRKDDR